MKTNAAITSIIQSKLEFIIPDSKRFMKGWRLTQKTQTRVAFNQNDKIANNIGNIFIVPITNPVTTEIKNKPTNQTGFHDSLAESLKCNSLKIRSSRDINTDLLNNGHHILKSQGNSRKLGHLWWEKTYVDLCFNFSTQLIIKQSATATCSTSTLLYRSLTNSSNKTSQSSIIDRSVSCYQLIYCKRKIKDIKFDFRKLKNDAKDANNEAE